jgi:hypothetical protein
MFDMIDPQRNKYIARAIVIGFFLFSGIIGLSIFASIYDKQSRFNSAYESQYCSVLVRNITSSTCPKLNHCVCISICQAPITCFDAWRTNKTGQCCQGSCEKSSTWQKQCYLDMVSCSIISVEVNTSTGLVFINDYLCYDGESCNLIWPQGQIVPSEAGLKNDGQCWVRNGKDLYWTSPCVDTSPALIGILVFSGFFLLGLALLLPLIPCFRARLVNLAPSHIRNSPRGEFNHSPSTYQQL